MRRLKPIVGGIVVAFSIAGCGSTEVVNQPSLDVSIGQQLIDLKNARDSGAITEQEFQREKANLIDSLR